MDDVAVAAVSRRRQVVTRKATTVLGRDVLRVLILRYFVGTPRSVVGRFEGLFGAFQGGPDDV